MRTNLPKAPPRRDKAAGNPRRNPTRLDTQQTYRKMKEDMWRQLTKGWLVPVPRESLGMWREAHSLVNQGLVSVEAQTGTTMYIKLKLELFPEINFAQKKSKEKKKFYLHHLNHQIDEEAKRLKGTSHTGANGRRVWIAEG
jgi:hypothetical protein